MKLIIKNISYDKASIMRKKLDIISTVRPRGTRPRGTRTSLGHDFKKGSKIFEISDFGS